MKQMTLAAGTGFEKHARPTRKGEFLAGMEPLVPWAEFCALIEPQYPRTGNGRPPIGLERMLRMYFLANWFNLADEACEDALYDVPVFREFCRIDLGRAPVPDATTLLNFRHLLEAHKLGAAMFAKVGELLLAKLLCARLHPARNPHCDPRCPSPRRLPVRALRSGTARTLSRGAPGPESRQWFRDRCPGLHESAHCLRHRIKRADAPALRATQVVADNRRQTLRRRRVA